MTKKADKKVQDQPLDQEAVNNQAKDNQTDANTSEAQESAVDGLQEELDQYKDKYLRLTAEFDNYRRRTAKERLELINSAGEQVIKGFLPILDDCERAMQVLSQSQESGAAKEGTELIFNKLKSYLGSQGLTLMETVGKDFDTDFHEAVAQIPAPTPEQKNKIVDVIQQGYLLNGKVIRYAKVVIGI
ncbi:MAG: nucleotide exchange factor GrpE [Bacteroidales bacterium]|nr:nucleotide exchange factor GrpE [Bacteroidales bacterium]